MKDKIKLQIEMIPNDIQIGIPASSGQCPIALAINRAFPQPVAFIRIGSASALVLPEFFPRNIFYRGNLPEIVQEFIKQFDMLAETKRRNLKLVAFEIELIKSSECIRVVK